MQQNSGGRRYSFKQEMQAKEREKQEGEGTMSSLRSLRGWGWAGLLPVQPIQPEEGNMKAKTLVPGPPKLPRKVLWRSKSGRLVVVEGPFPDNTYRSETRDSVAKAAKLAEYDMYTRPRTTKPGQYAKCLAADIAEIRGGENEFGEVTP